MKVDQGKRLDTTGTGNGIPLSIERIVMLPLNYRSHADTTLEQTILNRNSGVPLRESAAAPLENCGDSRVLSKSSDGEISSVSPAPHCHLLLINKWIVADMSVNRIY